MISFKQYLQEANDSNPKNPHAGIGRGLQSLHSKLKRAVDRMPQNLDHMKDMTAEQASNEANRIETIARKRSAIKDLRLAASAHSIALTKNSGNGKMMLHHERRKHYCEQSCKVG